MAGVLKRGEASGGASPGGLDAEACEDRCRARLAAAEAEAEEVLRDAERRAAALREEARRAGREEGRAEAAACLAEAAAARDALLAGAERDVRAIALAVAERLLRGALAEQPALVVELAAAAVTEARGARRVRLRAHPDDLAQLATARDRLAELAGGGALDLAPDPSLRPGDAVVETEAGTADARLEAQLEALRRALEEVR